MRMELRGIASLAVALARKAGADEAEAAAYTGTEFSARVRLGEVESLHEARSRAIGLRVFAGRRQAVTYTSDLSEAALSRFAEEAVALARLGEEDALNRLPDGPFAGELPALDLYD